MARILATVKAIFTRLLFATHALIAVWQVVKFMNDPRYWYLYCPAIILLVEGLFTLTVKPNQEWKWFCPSVFFYLASVVPAIWFLELYNVDRVLQGEEKLKEFEGRNMLGEMAQEMANVTRMIGVDIDIQWAIPKIPTETWTNIITQVLMLALIIGRWLLPKGDLTRDQLSQLLLVYIGTAADIIEFSESYKETDIKKERVLVYLTLGIWSWSLMQFTIVLTSTRLKKSRLSSGTTVRRKIRTKSGCCSMEVWAIMLNMILQDAPFLAFRLLLIIRYKKIDYMNVFFASKNSLVLVFQLYRLYVILADNRRKNIRRKRRTQSREIPSISIVSRNNMYENEDSWNGRNQPRDVEDGLASDLSPDDEDVYESSPKKLEKKRRKTRQDTGYSTSSSRNSAKHEKTRSKDGSRNHSCRRDRSSRREEILDDDYDRRKNTETSKSSRSKKVGDSSKSTLRSGSDGRRGKRNKKDLSVSIDDDLSFEESRSASGSTCDSEERHEKRSRRSRD